MKIEQPSNGENPRRDFFEIIRPFTTKVYEIENKIRVPLLLPLVQESLLTVLTGYGFIVSLNPFYLRLWALGTVANLIEMGMLTAWDRYRRHHNF